tara:strand:- start:499 stop:1509 length:1011 start_codon:yes stop_codon:yes gene_type:complete
LRGDDLKRVGVIGAGAWGTALACVAARAGREVVIWAREEDVVNHINQQHENTLFLPGVTLDPRIRATEKLQDMANVDVVLMVAPAQFVGQVSQELAKHLPKTVPVVLCAKGIEQSSGRLMTDVLAQSLPYNAVAVLSGPTFAIEAAKGMPSAVTLACADHVLGQKIVAAMAQPKFRMYLSHDLIGAEIGGAVKNVLAIACGIVEGLKLGENARSALITRGFAEVVRFGHALGAETETMMGLCGLGDLILTCSSPQSRNMSLGMALAHGETLDDIMSTRRTVAEGVHTARILHEIAIEKNIDMPICAAVNAVLHEGKALDRVIDDLLHRPVGMEYED